MKLYKVTNGFGDYWVIAKDPKEAEEKTEKYLEYSDYGFRKDRVMKLIEVIATSSEDKRFITGHNLIP